METESAQTDRTIETAKRETELKQKLEAAKEARVENETKCEEIAKGLNIVPNQAIDDLKKDIKDQTQKLKQAERTTQDLQQRFEEIGEREKIVAQELGKCKETLKTQEELLDKKSSFYCSKETPQSQ